MSVFLTYRRLWYRSGSVCAAQSRQVAAASEKGGDRATQGVGRLGGVPAQCGSRPSHLPGQRVRGISVKRNAVGVLDWVCSRRRSLRFKKNLQSAALHASVVDEYLQEEVAAGRAIGPLPQEVAPVLWISRFGVIPNRNLVNGG